MVAANPQEWSVDPFAGAVKDGYVYGRGAYDMKSMTAIEIMAIKLLKKNQRQTQRRRSFGCHRQMRSKAAKKEQGTCLRNHKEKVWCPYVINEGGGLAFPSKKGYVFPVQTAEKGILWIRIKAKGTPGHGSMPNMADNAVIRMNKVIDTLGNYRPKPSTCPRLKSFLLKWENRTQNCNRRFLFCLPIHSGASKSSMN